MSGLYGKLNKEVEKVSLRGGETPTANVRIENNIIYVDHKADRVLDVTSDRPVQNKTLASKFSGLDESLATMKESIDKQWSLVRHLNAVIGEQVELVAKYNAESIERDADLLDKIMEVKHELEEDIVNLANFIARYEEELSHLKDVDKANEEATTALRAAYDIKMAELDATDDSIREDISNFKKVYDETVNAFTNEDIRINSRIDDLTIIYNQKMSDLDAKDAEIVQSIVDAIAQHNQDIANLLDKHNQDIADVRQEQSDSIGELTEKYDTKIASMEELIKSGEGALKALGDHNTDESAHEYIRGLIAELDNRLDAFLGDDNSAAALSDLLEYLQANGDLIDSLDTNKINYSDIIDNVTSDESKKPLSAKQGKVLSDAISEMSKELSEVYNVKIGELEEADTKIEENIASLQETGETLDYEIKVVKSAVSDLSDTVYNELSSLLEIDLITGGTAPIEED